MNMSADDNHSLTNPVVLSKKQIIAAVIFSALALFLATVVPSVEIAWVTAILVLTIYLFAFEVVGVDASAALVAAARKKKKDFAKQANLAAEAWRAVDEPPKVRSPETSVPFRVSLIFAVGIVAPALGVETTTISERDTLDGVASELLALA